MDQLLREEQLPPFNWPVGIVTAVAIVAAVLIAIYWPERKRKYTSREKKESKSAYKFLLPWLIGMSVFTVGPMVLSLLMSTMNWDMIQPPQWRGAGNFREALTEDPRFWRSLQVTLFYTLIGTPIGIAFAPRPSPLAQPKGPRRPTLSGDVLYPLHRQRRRDRPGCPQTLRSGRRPDQFDPVFAVFKPLGDALSSLAGTPF